MSDTEELEEFIEEHKGPGYSYVITKNRIVLTLDDPVLNGDAPAITIRSYESDLWDRLRASRGYCIQPRLGLVERHTTIIGIRYE